jgi:hypothetical protein
MTPQQMETFRQAMGVRPGYEWDKFEGLSLATDQLQSFLDRVPFSSGGARRLGAPALDVPDSLPVTIQPVMSTQTGFGAILNEIGREDSSFARHIVTTSPDVTVSTNLGPWVNRRGLFARQAMADTFKSEHIPSTFNWEFSPKGQHIELGIAEMNLFTLLSALGLSHTINGERLLPIGTFVRSLHCAGLDALITPLSDARFMLVATPPAYVGGRRRRASIDRRAADRAWPRTPRQLRAGLRGRARGHRRWAFSICRRTATRHRPIKPAARRDRRVGVSALIDAAGGTNPAQNDAGAAPTDRRWRLLASQTGA